jgi:group I intron endonuclease
MTIIYKATCLANGKVYIGQTRNTLQHRWKQHLNEAEYSPKKRRFIQAIRLHGAEKFIIESLGEVTDQDADMWECTLIAIWSSASPEQGYNGTTGGKRFALAETPNKKLQKEWDDKLKALGLAPITRSEFIPAKPVKPQYVKLNDFEIENRRAAAAQRRAAKNKNSLDVRDGQDGTPSSNQKTIA